MKKMCSCSDAMLLDILSRDALFQLMLLYARSCTEYVDLKWK